eukprot:3634659-Rhodomonas_salina.1
MMCKLYEECKTALDIPRHRMLRELTREIITTMPHVRIFRLSPFGLERLYANQGQIAAFTVLSSTVEAMRVRYGLPVVPGCEPENAALHLTDDEHRVAQADWPPVPALDSVEAVPVVQEAAAGALGGGV